MMNMLKLVEKVALKNITEKPIKKLKKKLLVSIAQCVKIISRAQIIYQVKLKMIKYYG